MGSATHGQEKRQTDRQKVINTDLEKAERQTGIMKTDRQAERQRAQMDRWTGGQVDRWTKQIIRLTDRE